MKTIVFITSLLLFIAHPLFTANSFAQETVLQGDVPKTILGEWVATKGNSDLKRIAFFPNGKLKLMVKDALASQNYTIIPADKGYMVKVTGGVAATDPIGTFTINEVSDSLMKVTFNGKSKNHHLTLKKEKNFKYHIIPIK